MPKSARRRESTRNPDPNIDIDGPQLRPKAQKTIAQVFSSFVYLKQPDSFHQQSKRDDKVSQKATPCIEPPVRLLYALPAYTYTDYLFSCSVPLGPLPKGLTKPKK